MQLRSNKKLAVLLCLLLCGIWAGLAVARQQQQQPDQQQQDKDKDKDKKQQDQKKDEQKKGGGLFGGMKRITSAKGSSESNYTATAGAKGVGPGDGKKIAEAQPTADDRAKVDKMAGTAPSPDELKKFLDEGKLATEKKGGQ
jgi:hypothetical protein